MESLEAPYVLEALVPQGGQGVPCFLTTHVTYLVKGINQGQKTHKTTIDVMGDGVITLYPSPHN